MKPGEVKKSFDFPEFLVKLLEGSAADNARTVGREVVARLCSTFGVTATGAALRGRREVRR